METLNLGVKFVKGWQDSTGSGSGFFGGSPQTGDLMLFIGLFLLGVLVAGVCGFAYARNKKLCVANHVNGGFVNLFNLASFNLTQKILIGIAGIVACSCIGLGIFGITAHADTNISSLISNKSEIEIPFNQDGTLKSDTCTLTNISANKLALQSAIVAIADTAKDVEGLENSEITITADDGKTIYAGIPSGIPYNLSNFTLNPNASITLNFNFDNIDKDTAIELCDKNVFDISINTAKYYNVSATSDENGSCTANKTEALEGETVTLTTTPNTDYEFASWETLPSGLEITDVDASTHTFTMPAQDVAVKALFTVSLPDYENLYEYSLSELQQVSAYLAENYTEESQDPVCVKFRGFRDNGLTSDGSDNGVDMITNSNKNNHWAIDINGKLFEEAGFTNDATTIQVRIIGIKEDVDKNDSPIGLTFMTTHILNATSEYDSSGSANYGWSGDSPTGSCTLRTFLADGEDTLFPSSLKDSVKAAKKGYKYSSGAGGESNTAIDKFWAPSMKELYGDCSGEYDGSWPNQNEGNQYKAFSENQIAQISYGPFFNLDIPQDGNTSDRSYFVWSRSLSEGDAYGACGVGGSNGGSPDGSLGVSVGRGVVACFCI